MYMKKTVIFLVAMMMVMSLVACGEKAPAATTATQAPVMEVPTTEAPVEETTVPETTEVPTEAPYDGVLRPYLPALADESYRAGITLISDDTVSVDLYGMETYRASDVDQLQVGDKIVTNGEEIEITNINIMPVDNVDVFIPTIELNNDNSLQLLPTPVYDFDAEPDENGFVPYTYGDYVLTDFEGNNFKVIATMEVKLDENIFFTDSSNYNEETGMIDFQDLTGVEMLAMLKEHPEKFPLEATQASVFEGKINSFNITAVYY